jgi:hypothetical protein
VTRATRKHRLHLDGLAQIKGVCLQAAQRVAADLHVQQMSARLVPVIRMRLAGRVEHRSEGAD